LEPNNPVGLIFLPGQTIQQLHPLWTTNQEIKDLIFTVCILLFTKLIRDRVDTFLSAILLQSIGPETCKAAIVGEEK